MTNLEKLEKAGRLAKLLLEAQELANELVKEDGVETLQKINIGYVITDVRHAVKNYEDEVELEWMRNITNKG